MLADRNGKLSAAERESLFTPMALGFYTTLVLEGAERSLAEGQSAAAGVTVGPAVDLRELVVQQLGAGAARDYGLA
jgi:hypothetical protein